MTDLFSDPPQAVECPAHQKKLVTTLLIPYPQKIEPKNLGRIYGVRNFVAQSLQQIVTGVKKAQDATADSGANINPRGLAIISTAQAMTNDDGVLMQKIDFDVAITVSEGKTKEGGAGIHVASIGIGIKGQSEATNSIVNRIKFSVPMFLPCQ